MNNKNKKLGGVFLLAVTIMLSACGGGSGSSGSSSDVSTSPNLAISVAVPTSGIQTTRVVGGQHDLTVDNGSVADPIAVPEEPTLMMALGENEELIWLAMADQTGSELDMDAESTALSLILLYPMISVAYSMSPAATRDAILGVPQFSTFRNVLESNGDWADMADPALQDAYGAVIVAAANAIEAAIADGTIVAKAQQRALSQKPVLDPVDSPVTRSGVRVDISGTHQPVSEPDTELQVSNLHRRWVGVLVSKNEDGSSPVDHFFMAPASSLTSWAGFHASISRTYPLSFIEDPTPLYISVLGPSLNSFPAGLSSIQQERAMEAALYTVSTELVMPVLSSMVGGTSCVKELLSPVLASPITFLAEQPQVRSLLLAGDYGGASAEAVFIILENASWSGAECLATQAGVAVASRLIPVIGQIKTFVDAVPAMIQVTDAAWSASESEWHEQWVFKNDTLADIDVTSESALRFPLAGYGAAGYVTGNNITDSMLVSFPGDCVAEQDTTRCVGFTFDSEPPWLVDVAVKCRHAQTKENVACREALFVPFTEAADSDGVVRRALEYTSEQEQAILIEAVDIYGARKQQTLHIQIRRAQPQLRFVASGLADFTVDGKVLTVDEPLELKCCDSGKETVTRTITLNNTIGNAAARISTGPLVDTPGFSVTMPSAFEIPAGESRSFAVTYDPRLVQDGEREAKITLHGELGGELLSNYFETHQYTTLALPVKGKSDCNQGEMIAGRYEVRGDNCELIFDHTSGLEWQRCAVGQTYEPAGNECLGGANTYIWADAITQTAPGGFGLPTREQLITLRLCSAGVIYKDLGASICALGYDLRVINLEAFPHSNSWYWSSSPYAANDSYAWYVSFTTGDVSTPNKSSYNHVRLVRGGQ